MPYIAPLDGFLGFDISGLYVIPPGIDINFDIGGTAPREILSANSEILFLAAPHIVFEGNLIESASAEIALFADKSLLDPVWPISSAGSDLFLEASRLDVEILPDIVNANAEMMLFFSDSVVRTPEIHDLPSARDSAILMGWDKGTSSDVHKQLLWKNGVYLLPKVSFVTAENPLVPHMVRGPWASMLMEDTRSRVFSGGFPTLDAQSMMGWGSLFILDHLKRLLIGGRQVSISANLNAGFLQPEANDVLRNVEFASAATKIEELIPIYWNAPGTKDTNKQYTWGPFPYVGFCDARYWAPKNSNLAFAFPNEVVAPAVASDALNFVSGPYSSAQYCPYDSATSGGRDPYNRNTIVVDNTPVFPAHKEIYYMLNFVFVREILSNTHIQVLAVEASIDRDSWLWQFNITVASRDCLEIIKPRQGVFINVEIHINGWKWICTVENWKENRKFGKDAWTITGRSPSMMLGSPVAEKRSGTVSVGRQGQQIFEGILAGVPQPTLWHPSLNSWRSDWSIYQGAEGGTSSGFNPLVDWYVLGNTFSYSDQMPIEVLQSITGAIGAYIQTEADPITNGCNLKVRPMYQHQPWSWGTANKEIAWKAVIDSQCTEIGRESVQKPYYGAVNVAGELPAGATAGTGALDPLHPEFGTAVFVSVHKANVNLDTASFAPMLTNRLITSSKVGMELGRMTIGNTAQWLHHTLRISTLCPPPSASAGVFTPGTMLAVNERGEPWYGQVTGTTIRAATANGAAFTVEQVLAVEEYVGG